MNNQYVILIHMGTDFEGQPIEKVHGEYEEFIIALKEFKKLTCNARIEKRLDGLSVTLST